jgi:hypothetical protein
MSGSYNVQPSERTEIIRGSENVIDAGLKFISNANGKGLVLIIFKYQQIFG